jgi:hypothetical protein
MEEEEVKGWGVRLPAGNMRVWPSGRQQRAVVHGEDEMRASCSWSMVCCYLYLVSQVVWLEHDIS